jgi:hypothetical protein
MGMLVNGFYTTEAPTHIGKVKLSM